MLRFFDLAFLDPDPYKKFAIWIQIQGSVKVSPKVAKSWVRWLPVPFFYAEIKPITVNIQCGKKFYDFLTIYISYVVKSSYILDYEVKHPEAVLDFFVHEHCENFV